MLFKDNNIAVYLEQPQASCTIHPAANQEASSAAILTYAIHNIAIMVLSLLHGNLNFDKTITTAVMCGIDTDCNSATAGSIVGAAIGYDRLEQKWVAPLQDTAKTVVANFGEGTITDLIQRTIIIQGGKIRHARIRKAPC